jgi:hypothetical protein
MNNAIVSSPRGLCCLIELLLQVVHRLYSMYQMMKEEQSLICGADRAVNVHIRSQPKRIMEKQYEEIAAGEVINGSSHSQNEVAD